MINLLKNLRVQYNSFLYRIKGYELYFTLCFGWILYAIHDGIRGFVKHGNGNALFWAIIWAITTLISYSIPYGIISKIKNKQWFKNIPLEYFILFVVPIAMIIHSIIWYILMQFGIDIAPSAHCP